MDACYRGLLSVSEGGGHLEQVDNNDHCFSSEWFHLGFAVWNDGGHAHAGVFDLSANGLDSDAVMLLTFENFNWTYDDNT